MKYMLESMAKMARNFPLEIISENNVPIDDNVIFVVNHSNSHDCFIAFEINKYLKRNISLLVAEDCLSTSSKFIFSLFNTVFIDRNDKKSCSQGYDKLKKDLLSGKDVLIFGESTWNLHPTKPMLPIKYGPVKLSMETNKKIVPVIFEYIECNDKCDKESQLYNRCIVKFSEPITPGNDLKSSTNILQAKIEKKRLELWKSLNIRQSLLSEINGELYVNHTFIKKNTPFFKLNGNYEAQFILPINGIVENEYVLENGVFKPKVYTNNDKGGGMHV